MKRAWPEFQRDAPLHPFARARHQRRQKRNGSVGWSYCARAKVEHIRIRAMLARKNTCAASEVRRMKNVQNRHVAIEAFLRIRRLEVVILTDLMKTDKSSSNALRRFLLISHNSAPTDEVLRYRATHVPLPARASSAEWMTRPWECDLCGLSDQVRPFNWRNISRISVKFHKPMILPSRSSKM